MKKLNKIFILFVLFSFVSCGTAQVAYDDEAVERSEGTSSREAGKNPESAGQTGEDGAPAGESGEKGWEFTANGGEAGTSGEAGTGGEADGAEESEEEPDANANYEGNHYNGPAAADFTEGMSQYEKGGCDAAMEPWKSAFGKDPKNARIAFNIAVCYDRMKDKSAAAEWYGKSFKSDRSFMLPLYNSALLYSQEQLKDKESYFVQQAEKNSDVVERYNFLAWFYIQLGRPEEAEKFAKMALKEDEQNSEAVITLATSYYNKKMYELAESALETAEKWDAENFRLQRLYGLLLYKTGDTKGATTHLMKAVKINPELPEVRNILAVLAMKIEDYATAKEQLEAALKIKDDFWSAKLNLALAYKGLEEYKNSAAVFNELEERTDLNETLRNSVIFNKALLYLDADVDGDKNPARFDTAVKYFNEYLKLIAKSKTFKKEKALVDGYIKEANTEKKKLEFALAAKAKAEKKKREQEEEARLFQQNKEAAFKKAEEENTAEAWNKYLEEFPVSDESDTLGMTAKAKLDELTKAQEQPQEAAPEQTEAQPEQVETPEQPQEAAPEQTEAQPEQAEAQPEQAEAPEQPEAQPEQAETPEQPQEAAPEQTEEAQPEATESPEQPQETAPEVEEAAPEKTEVQPEQAETSETQENAEGNE